MNKKTFVGIASILLLLFIAWRLLPAHGQPKQTDAAASAQNQPASVPTATPVSTAQKLVTVPSADERVKSPEEKQQGYLEKTRGLGNSLNRPGSFYGQIIDQNSQPVAGVKIKCGLSYFNDDVLPGLKPHYDEFERTTDNLGRFSVEGQRGLSLDLKLQPMQGYEFRPTGLGVTLRDIAAGQPAPTLSVPDKPYVFRAFKKGQAEPLIKGGLTMYDCVPDGRSYIVNLRSNRAVEGTSGGDFKLSIQRPPGRTNQSDYDWSVRIEGADMDLLETHDVFMYQAPESGYVSSWGFSRKAGEKDYTREVKAKFYIRSRNGSTFGRIEIQIISDYREASGLIVDSWLNPRWSRNLEYDPLQNVAKQSSAAKP